MRVELEKEVCLIISISAAPESHRIRRPTPSRLPGRWAMYTCKSQHVKVLANITKNAAQFFAAAPPLDSTSESQLWFEIFAIFDCSGRRFAVSNIDSGRMRTDKQSSRIAGIQFQRPNSQTGKLSIARINPNPGFSSVR